LVNNVILSSFCSVNQEKVNKVPTSIFDYKDIKGGAELPGNIKVDLA